MRLPIIPAVVAAALLGAVWYLFNATRSGERIIDVPRVSRLTDIEGTETEIAVSSDDLQYAVIASGKLWLLNAATGERKQLTQTTQSASFPAWTPDGKRITFTRGSDTFAIGVDSGNEELLLANATYLSWSSTNRIAFVRDRALWIAAPDGQAPTTIAEADPIPDVSILCPRFSPDGSQVAYIKSQLGLRGEVWLADAGKGMVRPLVADRATENPLDSGWINGGRDLVYLTNRAGAYSLWYVDLAQSTINPLTQPLVTVPLARIGIAVSKDRILVPRHFIDSNIVLSDGTTVAATDKLEFQPAASPDGKLVAYTVADENKSEVWTTSVTGDKPVFRALGREPRFSASGFEIVYTHTDLAGNDDIWKMDLRNSSSERVTDADEIDVSADWSSDGRSIAFASARGGAISIWTTPAAGGKRLRINEAGYAPRYSPDSKSILFWNRQALWIMEADGKNPHEVARDLPQPMAGVWDVSRFRSSKPGNVPILTKPPVDYPVLPEFDMLADGRLVLARLDIRETGLWAIDLTYKEK